MKKLLVLLMFIGITANLTAQSTVGLVAHWDMNGTVNDVSGNGHNGHANNIVSAVGMDGISNHGYYFNGTNSWVSVPYSPAFNVANYSICATVKVTGFYTGAYHASVIMIRGKTNIGNCVYTLQFSDAPAGISGTGSVDSSKETFWTGSSAPSATLSPASISSYNYTPYIAKNLWYKVVATFNDTTYKLYVDGVLKNSANIINAGLPMGTGTDSISIGYDLKEASSGYPYPFKGVIDDIMLYDRVLSDSEVAHYGDTCGKIITQPVRVNTHVGGNAVYSIVSTIAGGTYQWQQDGGTGYVSLTNSGPYSGVFTSTLTVTGVTAGIIGSHYRCLVSNSWGCYDTSNQALLTTGLDDIDITSNILLYPNPATDELSIRLPNSIDDATVEIFNQLGVLVQEEKINLTETTLKVQNIPPGIYYVKIITARGSGHKKILKY